MPKPSSSRQKGRNFEKQILKRFKECFELDEDDARCAPASVRGTDIILTKRAQEIVGLGIECKNVKSLNVWAALEQAMRNTPEGSEPALVFHRSVSGNRNIWIAVPLEHYLNLREQISGKRS